MARGRTTPDPDPAAHALAALVDERLTDRYGDPRPRGRSDALDGLVGTILSQHTSDVNSGAAFASLKARLPTWEAVLAAPEDELAEAIRRGGLANVKAPRIRRVLATIKARYGRLDLDWLGGLPRAEARAVLTDLDGVGPKTAACVLLFNLGLPAMPVDTHVHRVAGRIGLIPPKTGADAAHEILERLVPAERVYAFHINLIRHGREVCKALRPRCPECPLVPDCDYGRRALLGAPAGATSVAAVPARRPPRTAGETVHATPVDR